MHSARQIAESHHARRNSMPFHQFVRESHAYMQANPDEHFHGIQRHVAAILVDFDDDRIEQIAALPFEHRNALYGEICRQARERFRNGDPVLTPNGFGIVQSVNSMDVHVRLLEGRWKDHVGAYAGPEVTRYKMPVCSKCGSDKQQRGVDACAMMKPDADCCQVRL